MSYNILENIAYCGTYVADFANLLLYSHIPTALLALTLGLYVRAQSKELLVGKIFFFISQVFTLWVSLNLAVWFFYDRSDWLMFAWTPIEFLGTLLFGLCFYFVYVFLSKHDATPQKKLLFGGPLFFLMLLMVTDFNLVGYDLQECIAIENDFYLLLNHITRFFYIISIVVCTGYWLYRCDKNERRVFVYLAGGTLSFLLAFWGFGMLSSATGDFTYEAYGLFAVVFFIGVLTYLIVEFHAFHMKLAGAQALVVALVLLISSQFFFIQNPINRVLTGITVALSIGFGYLLIRSVKRDMELHQRMESLALHLTETNNRLRELDEQKTEFVSIASHQLRAPLSSIIGYASLLLEGSYGKLSPQARMPVRRIYDSGRTMAIEIEDFLNVTRIEQGSMRYQLEPLNMAVLVKDIVGDFKEQAKKKELTLRANIPRHALTVIGDKAKLKQVITNLLDNALKYTPHGTITVTLTKDLARALVVVTVADEGIGIAKSEQGKLFMKFTRASNANSSSVRGTGLGLYLVREMVTAHGGEARVESEGIGHGSTFIIELPLASGGKNR